MSIEKLIKDICLDAEDKALRLEELKTTLDIALQIYPKLIALEARLCKDINKQRRDKRSLSDEYEDYLNTANQISADEAIKDLQHKILLAESTILACTEVLGGDMNFIKFEGSQPKLKKLKGPGKFLLESILIKKSILAINNIKKTSNKG